MPFIENKENSCVSVREIPNAYTFYLFGMVVVLQTIVHRILIFIASKFLSWLWRLSPDLIYFIQAVSSFDPAGFVVVSPLVLHDVCFLLLNVPVWNLGGICQHCA